MNLVCLSLKAEFMVCPIYPRAKVLSKGSTASQSQVTVQLSPRPWLASISGLCTAPLSGASRGVALALPVSIDVHSGAELGRKQTLERGRDDCSNQSNATKEVSVM